MYLNGFVAYFQNFGKISGGFTHYCEDAQSWVRPVPAKNTASFWAFRIN